MTYQKGSVILASDLNGFLTTTNNVYGVGSADRGYGQTAISQSAVSIGGIISSAQWTNLRSMVVVAANHQGTSITNLPPSGQLAVGHIIVAHEQNAPSSNAYDLNSYVTAIDTNRLNTSNTSLSTTANVFTATRVASWSQQIVGEFSVIWPSEDAARYYFNSGGRIQIHGTQPGTNAQDIHWNNSLTVGVGTVKFAAHSTTNTGSFSGGLSVGFYELTNSYQNVYTGIVSTTSAGGTYYTAYSEDTFTIQAKRLNYVGVHSGNGNGVQFKIILNDAGPHYTTTVSGGTTFNFDNVKATTFLSGILSPSYATVSAFA